MARRVGGDDGGDEDPPLYYRVHVFCCVNERPADHPRGCCLAKGSQELRDYMKARAKDLRLRQVRINPAWEPLARQQPRGWSAGRSLTQQKT